jgi:hypothetical protein
MANGKIRKSAQGKDCTIRIPGVCNFNPETTVSAHVGRKRGMGSKCHDIHTVYACSDCHDVIDGRVKHKFTPEDIVVFKFDAMEETQLIMLEEGLIKV